MTRGLINESSNENMKVEKKKKKVTFQLDEDENLNNPLDETNSEYISDQQQLQQQQPKESLSELGIYLFICSYIFILF